MDEQAVRTGRVDIPVNEKCTTKHYYLSLHTASTVEHNRLAHGQKAESTAGSLSAHHAPCKVRVPLHGQSYIRERTQRQYSHCARMPPCSVSHEIGCIQLIFDALHCAWDSHNGTKHDSKADAEELEYMQPLSRRAYLYGRVGHITEAIRSMYKVWHPCLC